VPASGPALQSNYCAQAALAPDSGVGLLGGSVPEGQCRRRVNEYRSSILLPRRYSPACMMCADSVPLVMADRLFVASSITAVLRRWGTGRTKRASPSPRKRSPGSELHAR